MCQRGALSLFSVSRLLSAGNVMASVSFDSGRDSMGLEQRGVCDSARPPRCPRHPLARKRMRGVCDSARPVDPDTKQTRGACATTPGCLVEPDTPSLVSKRGACMRQRPPTSSTPTPPRSQTRGVFVCIRTLGRPVDPDTPSRANSGRRARPTPRPSRSQKREGM